MSSASSPRPNTTFNSLSRDHESEIGDLIDDLKRLLSTPSLGITHRVQHDGDCDQHDAAFNSLSRDHFNSGDFSSITSKSSFFLSTPSLGITKEKLRGARSTYMYFASFNSLSRDHEERCAGIDRGGDQVTFNSLSRDHNPLITLFSHMTGLRPFNSLSRDHLRLKAARVDAMIRVNFQLPLSGSHAPSYRSAAWGASADFQLPLSGSPSLYI